MLGAAAAEKSRSFIRDELEPWRSAGQRPPRWRYDAGDEALFFRPRQHPVDGGHNLGVVHRMAGGGVGLEGDAISRDRSRCR